MTSYQHVVSELATCVFLDFTPMLKCLNKIYWLLFPFDSFEKELKNKLQQKSSGITSEEQVLKKSFKYFDLNGNGTVEPDEFAKAVEKIGIMIPTKQVSFSTKLSNH